MNIGLLIIGNEILQGKISDTNTRQLSLFLRTHHLELKTAIIVQDYEMDIHEGLKHLYSECDVVITSGGVGPTKDDVTKESLASYLGRKTFFSEEAFKVAAENYKRFGRNFPGKEHGYCFLPQGFIPLSNFTGLAPGLFAEHLGKLLFSLPGVPREFKSMLEEHFIARTQNYFSLPSELIELVTIRTKKIPEEKIFGEVDTTLWDKLAGYGQVSSLPTLLGVDIGVKLTAPSQNELTAKKEKVLEIFANSPINKNIWQNGNFSLEEYVVKVANQKNITYAFAESCTGGLCAHRITSVPGSSQTFLGSVVCYSESVKVSQLHVQEKTLKKFSVVSPQVAAEMSKGLSLAFKSAIAISITGIAGPGGGTEETPVGTAYIGVTVGDKTHEHLLQLAGDREQLKMRFSQSVLHLLLEALENYS